MIEPLNISNSNIAVSAAMMSAVRSFTGDSLSGVDPSVYEKELEALTRGVCINACEKSVDFLYRNFRDEFPVMCFLHHEKVQTHAARPIGVFHEYFLVKDKNGTWFAASPANHNRYSGNESRLKKVFSSKDLNHVLSGITEFEGGNWASKELIEETLKKQQSPCVWHNGKVGFIDFVSETTGEEYTSPRTVSSLYPLVSPDLS